VRESYQEAESPPDRAGLSSADRDRRLGDSLEHYSHEFLSRSRSFPARA
jgi:hypothetical protein